MRRTTFELGNFVTIIPYWYNKYNKYSQSVKEANLSIFQQEVQSTQHKTSFFLLLFALPPISHLVHSVILSLQSFLQCFFIVFHHCLLMKRLRSLGITEEVLQPLVVRCVSLSVSPLLDQLYSCSFSERCSCKLFRVGSGLCWPPWSQ